MNYQLSRELELALIPGLQIKFQLQLAQFTHHLHLEEDLQYEVQKNPIKVVELLLLW
jgi:hypothetical protein